MPQPTIIAVGELLVEFVSHETGCKLLALTDYSGPYPSGAPAICIDQAARMGAPARIFGAVGSDNFGVALLNRLQANGVGVSGVAQLEGKPTGVAFVSYYEDGSRTFIFHLDHTAADSIDTASINIPGGPVIMHISGSSLGNPRLRAAIETTASAVLSRGGQISCDPNARPELMRDPAVKNALTSLIGKCRYLFPSDSDLEFLYPDQTRETAIEALLATGVEIIALTRGAAGSILYTRDSTPIHLGGHVVEEVDPTGAGDCYCGTFLAMVSRGHSPEYSGRLANAAGAIAVTRRGPMEGNSNLATVAAFISNNPAAE